MSSSRKTIFDLERRLDLDTEFSRTIADLKTTTVQSKSFSSKTLMQFLNDCIRTWPYRQAATNINQFTASHGFELSDPETDDAMLYGYELLLNLLHWAPMFESNSSGIFDWDDNSTVSEECSRCIENIEYSLEMLNLRVRRVEKEKVPQYVISKRNPQVDAVIETVPELAEALLSYLDIRNQSDLEAKKAVLKAIADYLEDRHKSKYYKGTMYASLEDNIFTVFNKAGIRHSDKRQWNLLKSARMKLYDQTFKAAIHLLQMEDVKEFNDTVSDLKKKQTESAEMQGKNSV